MVLVDSSVWIEFFRGKNQKLVEALKDLLDRNEVSLAIPVRIEILSGAPKESKQSLGRVLSALPLLYPSPETWRKIEDWIEEGLAKGERFGALDLLIAGIAGEQKALLWSLDKDFQRMEKLGWVSLFQIN